MSNVEKVVHDPQLEFATTDELLDELKRRTVKMFVVLERQPYTIADSPEVPKGQVFTHGSPDDIWMLIMTGTQIFLVDQAASQPRAKQPETPPPENG